MHPVHPTPQGEDSSPYSADKGTCVVFRIDGQILEEGGGGRKECGSRSSGRSIEIGLVNFTAAIMN